MKKLLKQEWKSYGAAVLLLGIILISYGFFEERWSFDVLAPNEFSRCVPMLLQRACNVHMGNIIITVIAYCIFKLYKYQVERKRCGREFLASLPVKKRTAELFYLVMDCMFVILSNGIYWIVDYLCTRKMLLLCRIEIPMVVKSMVPQFIVTVAYLLLLLAASHMVESLIVNGIWKIFGAVVALFLLFGVVCMGTESVCTEVGIYDYIFDFMLVGEREDIYGSNYDDYEWEEQHWIVYQIYEEKDRKGEEVKLKDLYNGREGGPEIYYDGRPIKEAFYDMAEGKFGEDFGEGRTSSEMAYITADEWIEFDCGIKNMEKAGRFPEPAVTGGNLLVAFILFALAVWAAGIKEASSQIFYFSFVKYVYALLLCITVWYMGIPGAEALWHKALVFIGGVCIAALFVYWMTPERKIRLK